MSVRTRLAVPLVTDDPPLSQQVEAARAAGADLVELRLDCLRDQAAAESFLASRPCLPVILTLRSAADGGQWTGAEAERIAILTRLARLHAGYVDVEYTAWRRSAAARRALAEVCGLSSPARAGAARAADGVGRPSRLIVSRHDVRRTPRNLAAVLDRLAATPAPVVKAVFQARDATDACRVLVELNRWRGRRDLIALSLGEAGLATRILAPKFGGYLTFACLDPRFASASGQSTVRELREEYRSDRIGPDTRVYGVVGWPLTHSRSPAVHNAAMAATGVDGVYVPWPVRPGYRAFARFLDTVTKHSELGVMGLSVTLPHKENAYRWLLERGYAVRATAADCRAVNTLIRCSSDVWEGDNTDVHGVRRALDTVGLDALAGTRVAVLGAGGAARAAILAVQGHARLIIVYTRSPARARRLAREVGCEVGRWEARHEGEADVVLNCTPVGQWPAADASPLTERALKPGMVVFDAVYQPATTCLLAQAEKLGCRVVRGVEMFIGQASGQYELWHGHPAPHAVMRAALLEAGRA